MLKNEKEFTQVRIRLPRELKKMLMIHGVNENLSMQKITLAALEDYAERFINHGASGRRSPRKI